MNGTLGKSSQGLGKKNREKGIKASDETVEDYSKCFRVKGDKKIVNGEKSQTDPAEAKLKRNIAETKLS